MRDRTMIKLGLLFMAVSVITGVNYSISAYNSMMNKREAPSAFLVSHGVNGKLEIGVLGQRLTMADPVKTAQEQAPVWRQRVMRQTSVWQAGAADFYVRMVNRVKELETGLEEQKNKWVNN